MSDRKRVWTYVLVGLGSEIGAVACALTANLTRDFDGPFHDASQVLSGAGLVAIGMAAEWLRSKYWTT